MPDMRPGQRQFSGWTLLEALERTAGARNWSVWIEADTANKRANQRGMHTAERQAERMRARIAYAEATKRAYSPLVRAIEEGRIVAYGSKGAATAEPTSLYAQGWKHLIVNNWQRSVMAEPGTPKVLIYNVQLFPFAHDKCTPSKLDGYSFTEAFRMCVLDDPEVVARSHAILPKHASVFTEGQFPGPMIEYRWPIEITDADLAYEFVRPLAFYSPGPPIPVAPAEVKLAAAALNNRWRALVGMLSLGRLVAMGTYDATGQEGIIGQLQWRRKRMAIDIQNGDLLEAVENKWAVRWGGLSLHLPNRLSKTPLAAEHPPIAQGVITERLIDESEPTKDLQRDGEISVQANNRHVETTTRASIAKAITSLWPEGPPSGLPVKVRNEQIRDWQKGRNLKIASDKSIQRFFREN